jgi:hypothetical protein
VTAPSRTLRVGVLLDGVVVPRWIERILWDLAHGEGATFAFAGLLPMPGRVGALRSLPFRTYERLDRALFRAPHDHAERVDVGDLLSRVETCDLEVVAGLEGFELRDAAVQAVRARELDVLVHLGSIELRGGVCRAAGRGFWTFDHQDLSRRGIPPGFWEMHHGDAVTETRLVDRSTEPARVIYQSAAATERVSLYRSRNPIFWKSAEFVQRALRAVAHGETPELGTPPSPGPGRDRAPGPFTLSRFAWRLAARWWRTRSLWRRFHWQWFVALRRAPDRFDPEALGGFTILPVDRERFHADPFLVEHEGSHHLFFEDAAFSSQKGVIRWLAIGPDGSPGPSRVVVERDYHLSYPFVFRWNSAFWMIPETSENHTIELYRATAFPEHWQLEKVLFHDVVAVDTTLWEEDGRFWLFTAMSTAGGSPNDELFLFHAASPLDSWTPHPMNPVVSDARRARPAGALFRWNGALIRPGQDCAEPYLGNESYGAAIWLNRIDVLDPHRYRETALRRIGPDWHAGTLATHTLNRAGAFEVMDGRRLAARRPRG